jgi:N utilization substance protein B
MRPREGREMSLKFLFASEFNQYTLTSDDSDSSQAPELLSQLAAFKQAFKASEEVWAFVKKVVSALAQNHQEIDSILESQLKNWKLDRLSYTDKNILRIALCEILYLDLNPKIAINEALELGKIYSNSDSASFINGILDSILEEKGLKHG